MSGQTYLSDLLNISRSTIRKGVFELLNNTTYDEIPKDKQPRTGGGRHFFCQKVDLKILLTAFMDGIKADSPTDSTVF